MTSNIANQNDHVQITNYTIEYVLKHLATYEEVFTVAFGLLEPVHFCKPGESIYRIVWDHIIRYHDEFGKLPDYEVLSARVQSEPPVPGMLALAEIDQQNRDDVIRWIYNRAPDLPLPPEDAAHPRHDDVPQAKAWLKALLLDRAAWDRLKQPGVVMARAWTEASRIKSEIEARFEIQQDTDVSLEALTSGTYSHNWLIKNVLVEGSPMIVGGPKKALKTSVLLDLAVSLGIGEAATFLNHHRFRVEKHVAVGMYSGESNAPTVAATVRNILASKNRKPSEAAVYLQFATPKLSADGDLAAIRAFIKKRNLKVIIFDPVYTTLLKGNAKASASNVFDMGAVLSTISEACLAEGATPIFAHHTVKNAGKQTGRNGATYKTYEPAELGDLAFAGFAEFARQWLLLARRAEYEPGTGKHELWLTTGGSAGFNGCYALDVDEGVMGEDFSGKKWEVRVQTQAEAAKSQVTAKVDAAAIREQEDRQKVLNALSERGGKAGITINKLMPYTGMRRAAVERHLATLFASRNAEICGEFKGGDLWRSSVWNQG